MRELEKCEGQGVGHFCTLEHGVFANWDFIPMYKHLHVRHACHSCWFPCAPRKGNGHFGQVLAAKLAMQWIVSLGIGANGALAISTR